MNKRLVSPVFMWIIVFIGIFTSFHFIDNVRVLPYSAFFKLLALLALVFWLLMFFGAVKVHKQPAVSAAKINHVVKSGVYEIVRHPIYSGDIVLFWGIFFFWPFAPVLASAVWMTIVLVFWMNLEEKALIEKFGASYKEYKNEVPMFLPRLMRFVNY